MTTAVQAGTDLVAYFSDDLRWAVDAVPDDTEATAMRDHYETAVLDAESLARRFASAVDEGRLGEQCAALDELSLHVSESLVRWDLVDGLRDPDPVWREWASGMLGALDELPGVLHRARGGFRDQLDEHLRRCATDRSNK